MNKQLHARKRRQFKSLSRQLNNLLQKEHTHTSKGKIETIVIKIKYLLRELSGVIARWEIKKTLGAATVIFGLATTSVQGQSFAEPIVNPFGLSSTGLNFLSFPVLADFDADGDADLLLGESGDGIVRFSYHENIGTISEPSFAASQISPFGLQIQGAYFNNPTAADIDNDGDLDIFTSTYYTDNNGSTSSLLYYENTGTPTNPSFASPQVNPFGIESNSHPYLMPILADLDGDGDIDLLANTLDFGLPNAYSYYEIFVYYENTGDAENPQFALPVLAPFGLSPSISHSPYLPSSVIADLDLDGDFDILYGDNGSYENSDGVEYNAGVFYFENIGDAANPQFEVPKRNPFGIEIPTFVPYETLFPALADLDNDGDSDFLGATVGGDFVYYENVLEVSTTAPQTDFPVNISPNPTSDYLNIDTNEPLTRIEIYDLLGKQLATYDGRQTQISIQDLSSGTYMIRLINQEGKYLSKRIEKL